MATWMVHLRIADALLPHLPELDETAFIMGSMAPDSGVPNEDWSEFHPPKSVSHFEIQTNDGERCIDLDAFRARYLNAEAMRGYTLRERSFFLGYYAHLLTDVRWSETIVRELKRAYAAHYAQDKHALYRAAKEDWYDLDFLYLEHHPDFRTFSIYENAVGFDNCYLDLFAKDAFENRRQYICGFYHSDEHGELHRDYRYLTAARADAFVADTTAWLLEPLGAL